jgi:hypothetical protein
VVSIRISERDRRVMVKCAVARWLTTGQLQRFCFRGVSADAARKSLRRLTENGYLVTHREHSMAEAIHGLGPKGRVALAAKGFAAEAPREPPRQVEHLIGINDIRIAAETSRHRVLYCFASWELQGLGWAHPVIPDLVAGMQCPERKVFFFEYDRSTEGLATLAKKFRLYEVGIPGVSLAALVLVANSDGRLETLARKIPELAGERPVVGCVLSELTESGMDARIFADIRGGTEKFGLVELAE